GPMLSTASACSDPLHTAGEPDSLADCSRRRVFSGWLPRREEVCEFGALLLFNLAVPVNLFEIEHRFDRLLQEASNDVGWERLQLARRAGPALGARVAGLGGNGRQLEAADLVRGQRHPLEGDGQPSITAIGF